jgi:hypothetical protein
MGFNTSSSSQTSKPVYWPGQKEAYSGVMNMMNAYMGLPTTTPQSATTQNNYGNWWQGQGGDNGLRRDYNPNYAYQQPAQQTQQNTGAQGQDYLSRLLSGYGGQLSAGLTDTERQVLENIGALKPSELYNTGKESILSTLRGDYNPLSSPYYSAMRERMQREGEQAVTGARQNANLYGGLSSTGMANVENRARATTANDINTILGGLYESERNRQTGLLPTALAYEQYPMNLLQQQLSAGGYERGVSQEALDRQYQEWIRQLTALGIPLQTVMALIGAPVNTEGKGSGSDFGLKLL